MISLIMVLHYDKNLFVFLFSESLLFIQIIISRCIFSCFLYHIFFSIFYKWDSIKSFILVILSQYLLIFMSCCSDPHRDFFFNLYYTMTRLTLPSLFCGMLLLFFFFAFSFPLRFCLSTLVCAPELPLKLFVSFFYVNIFMVFIS